MTARDAWLAGVWPQVRAHLPAAPATVVELGCGSLGGFVPMLEASGYQAVGIDPDAPTGAAYQRTTFEECRLPSSVQAIVACTSLHHVSDPRAVVEKIAGGLATGGVVVVVEWDWQSFDEATARWCFARLGQPEDHSWLHHQREAWRASGEPWTSYFPAWADGHGLHPWERLRDELDRCFQRVICRRGAYFFGDLAGTSEADELEAIGAGQIRATRVDYVGLLTAG